MKNYRKYFLGCVLGILVVGAPFFGANIFLSKIGEIGLDNVVKAQLSDGAGTTLYSSGLNQRAFSYKLRLMDGINPDVVAIGSSRAMQVRREFFILPFANLSRSVSSVGELEMMVDQLLLRGRRPKLMLLFVDPWWFNRRYAKNGAGDPQLLRFPEYISVDVFVGAVKALGKGNWIARAAESKNLGIHAILTGDGFAQDGSYHYVSAIQGKGADVKFLHTLSRISVGKERFEKSDFADHSLVRRTCVAISKIRRSGSKVVLIAPPFADRVWREMVRGGYGYIEDAHKELRSCMEGAFYDFSAAEAIPGSNDCEFIDGFHGGDVTYARMLKAIAREVPEIKSALAADFVDEFIRVNAGYAGGMTRARFLDGKEKDFNDLGCRK